MSGDLEDVTELEELLEDDDLLDALDVPAAAVGAPKSLSPQIVSDPPKQARTKAPARGSSVRLRSQKQLDLPSPLQLLPTTQLVGRPVRRKLTVDLANTVCQYLAGGAAITDVLGMLSITPQQFMKWSTRGQEGLALLEQDPAALSADAFGTLCCSLVQGMERALAGYRHYLTEQVHTSPDWFRNYKILERRQRDVWGKNAASETMSADADDQYL